MYDLLLLPSIKGLKDAPQSLPLVNPRIYVWELFGWSGKWGKNNAQINTVVKTLYNCTSNNKQSMACDCQISLMTAQYYFLMPTMTYYKK